MKMKKFIAVFAAAASLGALASCSSKSTSSEKRKTVGIAMPAQNLERWNRDGEYLEKEFKNAGYDVKLVYSDNDYSKQIDDVNALISEGVDLLLVAAIDSKRLDISLNRAKEKEIPIVAYDRLIMNTDAITYYVSFDNHAVGEMQAQYVIDALDLENSKGPFNIEFVAGDSIDNNAKIFFESAYEKLETYIESGVLNVLSGKKTMDAVQTKDWSTDAACLNMKKLLNVEYAKGEQLDAVICSNDSTALGVTQAIQSNYKGSNRPIVTGQDADVENVKNIVDGVQDMTIYKNQSDEAVVALEVCKEILSGKTPAANLAESCSVPVTYDTQKYNNGVRYVASYLLAPTAVITKDNLQTLVDTGNYKWDAENKYLEVASAN